MPELPEVETVKRVVEPQIIGKGKDYRSAPLLKVYGHGGEPCINCGDTSDLRTVIIQLIGNIYFNKKIILKNIKNHLFIV